MRVVRASVLRVAKLNSSLRVTSSNPTSKGIPVGVTRMLGSHTRPAAPVISSAREEGKTIKPAEHADQKHPKPTEPFLENDGTVSDDRSLFNAPWSWIANAVAERSRCAD